MREMGPERGKMYRNGKKILCTGLCAALLFLCACTAQNADAGRDKPLAAVSIVPQEEFVRAVCGELWDVAVMVPPGASPESYEPTPQTLMELSDASLYFSIGVPAEEQGILKALPADTALVELHVCAAQSYADLEMDGGRDPHIWLSPKRVMAMVEGIREAFSAADPDNAETYAANAAAYLEKLAETDAQIKRTLSGLASRKFIVFHPAFGYFADEYGLEMYALEEHGKEAAPKRLQELAELAKAENIRVLFYQAEVDSRQSEAFAEEIGGRALRLEPLAPDYTDNLLRMAQALAEAMP